MAQHDEQADTRVRAEKAWNRTLDALEKGRVEIRRISKVWKLKWDVTKMQKDRSDLYRRLGEETYRLLKEGQFQPGQLDETIRLIDQLSEKMTIGEQEIDKTVHHTHSA